MSPESCQIHPVPFSVLTLITCLKTDFYLKHMETLYVGAVSLRLGTEVWLTSTEVDHNSNTVIRGKWVIRPSRKCWLCKTFLPHWKSLSKRKTGVPIVAQWKRIQPGTMRLQAQSLASLRGLKIQRCCGCGVSWRLQLQFDPSLGTSISRGCSPKKRQKDKKKKKKAFLSPFSLPFQSSKLKVR